MKDEVLQQPFTSLAKPAQRALAGAGISNLQQLAQLTQKEFMLLHGIGKNALQTLTTAMQQQGLHFKSDK